MGYAVYKPSEDLPPEKCLDENGKLTDEGKIYAVDTIRNTLAYWNRYIRGEIYEVTIYEDCFFKIRRFWLIVSSNEVKLEK